MRSRCLDSQEFEYLFVFSLLCLLLSLSFFANNPKPECNIKRLLRSFWYLFCMQSLPQSLSESTNICCSAQLDKCWGKFTFAIQAGTHSCFRHELCKPCLSSLLLNLAKKRLV